MLLFGISYGFTFTLLGALAGSVPASEFRGHSGHNGRGNGVSARGAEQHRFN